MKKIWRRLKAFWQLLEQVEWKCHYCYMVQDCPMLLWPHERFHLICRYCWKTQNYPDYVKLIDPLVNEWRPVNWS